MGQNFNASYRLCGVVAYASSHVNLAGGPESNTDATNRSNGNGITSPDSRILAA